MDREVHKIFKEKIMKRVTGLGAVFFKTKDPKMLGEWYKRHLHIPVNEFGAVFKWKDLENSDATVPAITVWSPFEENTQYFSPSENHSCSTIV